MKAQQQHSFAVDSQEKFHSPAKRIKAAASRIVGDIWVTLPVDLIWLALAVTVAYCIVKN